MEVEEDRKEARVKVMGELRNAVREIPRKKATESNNVLKMAIRSRIKVFVRPDNLNMSGLEKASKDLHFSTVLVDGKKYLSASNNSPPST